MNARIGIDFGGVIVRNLQEDRGEDTSLQNSSGEQVARDGAFDAIRQLCSACDGHVWIVSKAGPRMQERTLSWLQSVDFFSRTSVQPDHVRFCLQREDKEKICRDLKITHFIDDRVHIMQILLGVVPHLCLFGEPGGERFCSPLGDLRIDLAGGGGLGDLFPPTLLRGSREAVAERQGMKKPRLAVGPEASSSEVSAGAEWHQRS